MKASYVQSCLARARMLNHTFIRQRRQFGLRSRAVTIWRDLRDHEIREAKWSRAEDLRAAAWRAANGMRPWEEVADG